MVAVAQSVRGRVGTGSCGANRHLSFKPRLSLVIKMPQPHSLSLSLSLSAAGLPLFTILIRLRLVLLLLFRLRLHRFELFTPEWWEDALQVLSLSLLSACPLSSSSPSSSSSLFALSLPLPPPPPPPLCLPSLSLFLFLFLLLLLFFSVCFSQLIRRAHYHHSWQLLSFSAGHTSLLSPDRRSARWRRWSWRMRGGARGGRSLQRIRNAAGREEARYVLKRKFFFCSPSSAAVSLVLCSPSTAVRLALTAEPPPPPPGGG